MSQGIRECAGVGLELGRSNFGRKMADVRKTAVTGMGQLQCQHSAASSLAPLMLTRRRFQMENSASRTLCKGDLEDLHRDHLAIVGACSVQISTVEPCMFLSLERMLDSRGANIGARRSRCD